MDGFREFLESSTIHGLTYIATTKNIFFKFFWISIVCTGFALAGILISSSFSSWQKSPVATSIETFPISKVQFPDVTVCPPEGSNTALNHDLVHVGNATVNMTVREELAEECSIEI